MAATPPRFIAQFDDIPLSLEYVNDGGEMSYAEYEYADADGSEFEDLGANARTFDCRAWFTKSAYDAYIQFEAAITARNTVHNFVHPARGLLLGIVTTYAIRHDERKRCAVVDFQFKEQLQGNIDNRATPLITPQIQDLFQMPITGLVQITAANGQAFPYLLKQ